MNNLSKIVREAERPGLEPATCWLQVQCRNDYATTPHCKGRGMDGKYIR